MCRWFKLWWRRFCIALTYSPIPKEDKSLSRDDVVDIVKATASGSVNLQLGNFITEEYIETLRKDVTSGRLFQR